MWFWKKKEVEDFHVTNFDEQIRDLRRRIEEQKQAIGYYTPQPAAVERHEEVVEPRKDLETTPQEKRNKELDDIKSKLMRRK